MQSQWIRQSIKYCFGSWEHLTLLTPTTTSYLSSVWGMEDVWYTLASSNIPTYLHTFWTYIPSAKKPGIWRPACWALSMSSWQMAVELELDFWEEVEEMPHGQLLLFCLIEVVGHFYAIITKSASSLIPALPWSNWEQIYLPFPYDSSSNIWNQCSHPQRAFCFSRLSISCPFNSYSHALSDMGSKSLVSIV